MKHLTLILILATALNPANASPPIETQELTPENVKALGFNVTVEVSSEGVTVDIAGPKSIETDCFPRKIGNSVFNKEGKEIATYIAMLSTSHQGIPAAFGHYWSNENTMSVFIDYICPPGKIYRSKRFIVSSLAKYLITSQSSSPASQAGRR